MNSAPMEQHQNLQPHRNIKVLSIYFIIDNLNCLQSVTQQKEAVVFLQSELSLSQQLQQKQTEELAKIRQELHNG